MPTVELNATQSNATPGVTPAPVECAPLAAPRSYVQWLLWLKQVLPAHHFVLFHCHGPMQQRVLRPLAHWPEKTVPGKGLTELARRCMQSGSVVCVSDQKNPPGSAVCFPDRAISAVQRVQYVLLLQRPEAANQDLQSDARLVSWALRSLERFVPEQPSHIAYPELVQWLAEQQSDALDTSFSQSQLMDRLKQVSRGTRCQLAHLKLRRGKVVAVRLLAVSGQSKIDNRLAAARAMVACIEQQYLGCQTPLQIHSVPASLATDDSSSLLVPIACENNWYAVALERGNDQPFSVAEQEQLAAAIVMSVSMLHFSDVKTLSVRAACGRCASYLRARIVSALPRSVLIAAAILLALVYLLLPVEHRVSAPLSVEAAQQHVLIAPADGFVESVAAKAGDTVSEGQVLATLEDLDLQLEQQKLHSEQLYNQQAFTEALAVHDRINVTRLKEEGLLIEKELAQLALRTQRMVLTSPVDAVVLSGSWDDFLGAAVKAGDTLYSLGSTENHKLVLDVSEYDVKSVEVGQSVAIRLSADPSQVYPGKVTAIMPLAVSRPSGNSVQVHATLDKSVRLLPGMRGLGKIQIGRSPRIMQWLQRAGARVLWLGWRVGLIK